MTHFLSGTFSFFPSLSFLCPPRFSLFPPFGRFDPMFSQAKQKLSREPWQHTHVIRCIRNILHTWKSGLRFLLFWANQSFVCAQPALWQIRQIHKSNCSLNCLFVKPLVQPCVWEPQKPKVTGKQQRSVSPLSDWHTHRNGGTQPALTTQSAPTTDSSLRRPEWTNSAFI